MHIVNVVKDDFAIVLRGATNTIIYDNTVATKSLHCGYTLL